MSISPAQMIRQVSGTESPALPKRSTPAPVSAARALDFTAGSVVAEQVVSSPAKLSTDVRVDDRHRIYYEVVNDRTGDVVCEIPLETVRKFGEDLIVPLEGDASAHIIDAQS